MVEIIIASIIVAIGILMIVFGVWAIIFWNDYAKLSSDIKEFFDKSNI